MESKREKKRRGGGLYFRGKKAKKGRKEIIGERWRCCSGETQVKGEMMRDISGSTIANDSILFRRRVARKPLLVNLRKLSFSHSRINGRYSPDTFHETPRPCLSAAHYLHRRIEVPFETRGCNIVLSLPIVYLSDGHRWPSFRNDTGKFNLFAPRPCPGRDGKFNESSFNSFLFFFFLKKEERNPTCH